MKISIEFRVLINDEVIGDREYSCASGHVIPCDRDKLSRFLDSEFAKVCHSLKEKIMKEHSL